MTPLVTDYYVQLKSNNSGNNLKENHCNSKAPKAKNKLYHIQKMAFWVNKYRNCVVAIGIPLYFIYYRGYRTGLSRVGSPHGSAQFCADQTGRVEINLFKYLYLFAF